VYIGAVDGPGTDEAPAEAAAPDAAMMVVVFFLLSAVIDVPQSAIHRLYALATGGVQVSSDCWRSATRKVLVT
jgi:hypothetical protein